MSDDEFRDGGFAIAPPFIHIGTRAIRARDINSVSIRSGSENAARGCLWAICGLFFGGSAFALGPLGWIVGIIIVLATIAAAFQAFQGAKGLKTIMLRIGAEDIEAYESSDAQRVTLVKTLIEKAMNAS